MNLTVHQSICIQQLRVDTVSNASILQIGTAGSVKSLANLYNTGGFASGPQKEQPVVVPLPAPR